MTSCVIEIDSYKLTFERVSGIKEQRQYKVTYSSYLSNSLLLFFFDWLFKWHKGGVRSLNSTAPF